MFVLVGIGLDSWIEVNFNRCIQFMECDDPIHFQKWVLEWRDPAGFEVLPVSPSKAVRGLFDPTESINLTDGSCRNQPRGLILVRQG